MITQIIPGFLPALKLVWQDILAHLLPILTTPVAPATHWIIGILLLLPPLVYKAQQRQ